MYAIRSYYASGGVPGHVVRLLRTGELDENLFQRAPLGNQFMQAPAMGSGQFGQRLGRTGATVVDAYPAAIKSYNFV